MTEDFKELTIAGGVRRTSSKWFADKGYAEQMAAFIAGIQKGKEPDVTVLDGARATIGCLRMLESARTLAPCAIMLD